MKQIAPASTVVGKRYGDSLIKFRSYGKILTEPYSL